MLGLEASDVPNLGQQQTGDDGSHTWKLHQSRGHGLNQLVDLPLQGLYLLRQRIHDTLQASSYGRRLHRSQAHPVGLQLLGQVPAGTGELLHSPKPRGGADHRTSGLSLQYSSHQYRVVRVRRVTSRQVV